MFAALTLTYSALIGLSHSNEIFENDNTGSFWQITDIHYDTNYSSPLIAPNLCRVAKTFRNSSTGRGGYYGDYACDSTWTLTVSAIEAMKSLAPNPDFILWTGDSIPHVSDANVDLEKIYSIIRNITDKLVATFPKVPIYPVLGNHDIWPTGQIPVANGSQYYADMLTKAGWDQLLNDAEQKTFRQGGFYSKLLRHRLRLVSLNSNLWNNVDALSRNVTDPAGHFQWLELEMQSAKNLSEKVILSGHIPPGVIGRTPTSKTWMYDFFNQRLYWILQRYGDIITVAIFGHEHTDSFRVVYNSDGKPVVPVFLAPSVTPWNSTFPGMGANNPALRLYHYSRATGTIKDYTQYYLNLTQANALQRANWMTEYRMRKVYDLQNVTAANLDLLVAKFRQDGSPLFQRYYEYNSVSLDRSSCVGTCKRRHLCAMTKIEFADYSGCLQGISIPVTTNPNQRRTRTTRDHPNRDIKRITYYLVGAVLVLLVLLFFILALCCCRRHHAVLFMGRSRYTLIQDV